MAVLVTGGYGHLGSWVCHDLCAQGRDVIIMSRSQHRHDYLEPFAKRITFYSCDVLDYGGLYRMFKLHEKDIEGIIHIAGLMGGPSVALKPHYNLRINLVGTLEMLEAARTFGVKKFVYISSGSVFGKRSEVPRDDTPLSPSDIYGSSKASSEFVGLQYANEYGLDFRAVRIYFAYGPGYMPSQLYPLYNAVFGALEGTTSIKMDAGADQQIDFSYVKDCSRAIRLIYDAETTRFRQYNTSGGMWKPLPELISIVNKHAPRPAKVDLGPGLLMPRPPSLDFTRLREEFGFTPQYSFEDGVKEYAQWIAQQKRR